MLKKWKNSKILQWIFLFIIMIIFLCIMGYWVIGEISLGFSTDIVIEILLFLFFLYIPIVCIKRIHILSELNINEIKVFRAIITEKKSVRSGEVITRKRNRFVAAKITDNITLYANCSSNIYQKAIVNKTIPFSELCG